MDHSPSETSSVACAATASMAPMGADIVLRSGCRGVLGWTGWSLRWRLRHGTCPLRMDIACAAADSVLKHLTNRLQSADVTYLCC